MIQVTNNYDLGATGIMNGQTGVVVDSREEGVRIDFEGELVDVVGAALADLDYANGITVHKSQGSQYKVVILPLYASAGLRLLNCPLVYTALTRATDLVVVVGTTEVLAKCIGNEAQTERCSAFPHYLQAVLDQTDRTDGQRLVQQRLLLSVVGRCRRRRNGNQILNGMR